MQQQLQEAQKKIAGSEVQGQAGGGLVTITLSGAGKVTWWPSTRQWSIPMMWRHSRISSSERSRMPPGRWRTWSSSTFGSAGPDASTHQGIAES